MIEQDLGHCLMSVPCCKNVVLSTHHCRLSMYLDYFTTSLDSAVRKIRLLQFHPGEFTGDVVCSFTRGSVGHLVPYDALSYVLGSQDYKTPVALSGHD